MKHLLALLAIVSLPLAAVTVRTVTVKSSSGDYTSLSAAIAGETTAHANLVTADIQLNIVLYPMTDTTASNINSFVTDATHYISVYPDSTARQTGVWDTGKYLLSVSDANALTVGSGYVRIDGIQVEVSSQSTTRTAVFLNGSTNGPVWFSNSLVRGCNSSFLLYGVSTGAAAVVDIWNVATAYMGTNGNSAGMHTASTGTVSIYSSTAIGSATGYGIQNAGATVTVKNCYGRGGTASSFNGTISITTSASSDSTTGTTGMRSIAYTTANFTGVTAGSEHLSLVAGGPLAVLAGTDTSGDTAPFNFTTDIIGAARGAGWNIGAFQIPPAAGGRVPRKVIIAGFPEWILFAMAGMFTMFPMCEAG